MRKIDIYNMGLENEYYNQEYTGIKETLFTRVFILAYIVSGILVAKKQSLSKNKIAWVNGNRGYEAYFANMQVEVIYHGKQFRNILNFRNKLSVYSPFTRVERIEILKSALIEFKKFRIKKIHFWLEFCYIYALVNKLKLAEIVTSHIADRQITWLSYISEDLKIDLEIYQHGISPKDYKPVNKIICTVFYGINPVEIRLSKRNIIDERCNCKFALKPYISTFVFDNLNVKNRYCIGVATQVNEQFVIELINKIKKALEFKETAERALFILMLHPLDNQKKYRNLEGANVVIEKTKKYLDIDVLITVNSTIVFDYQNAKFDGLTILIDEKELLKDSVAGYGNIKSFLSINEAIEYLIPIMIDTINTRLENRMLQE